MILKLFSEWAIDISYFVCLYGNWCSEIRFLPKCRVDVFQDSSYLYFLRRCMMVKNSPMLMSPLAITRVFCATNLYASHDNLGLSSWTCFYSFAHLNVTQPPLEKPFSFFFCPSLVRLRWSRVVFCDLVMLSSLSLWKYATSRDLPPRWTLNWNLRDML